MNAESKRTVLIVEDEALIRMLGADILECAGFRVLEAASADEAVDLLGEHDVQLLFSDIDMPGSMDGLELARHVHDRWPQMRLLLTSGHRNIEEGNLPDDGRFVRKPWTQAGLIKRINAILGAND